MFIFLIFMIFLEFLNAKDNSKLVINVGSGNNPANIQFVIKDFYNRKTGFKAFVYDEDGDEAIKSFKEIPYSNYFSDSYGILDPKSNELIGSGPETLSGEIRHVLKGYYTIILTGFSNTTYFLEIHLYDLYGNKITNSLKNTYHFFISSGSYQELNLFLDPTPGAPPPILTKVVTFQTIKEDIEVAYKLNQIGDDKFAKSLLSMINIAEKYYNRCEKMKDKDKLKKQCYRPVVAILRMMMKRLEVINKLCDNKTECKSKCKVKTECDEDGVFEEFYNKYRKGAEFKDFFLEWDKDEYHKHKKTCKRYVSDDALEIIATDINWLIKSFGEEVWNDYKKEDNPYIPEKYNNFFK
ncbi:MAG: hypothetical protein ACP5SD_07565 [Elusimicrobiales bacterium]